MKKKLTLFLVALIYSFNLSAQSNDFNLKVSYDFENGVIDSKGNTTMTLYNNAAIVTDAVRGKVLSVSRSGKGYAKMPMYDFGDTLTLSFWFKRHSTDDNSAWKEIFEFYNPIDHSNIYLMPVYGFDVTKSGLVYNNNGYTINSWDGFIGDGIPANDTWNHIVVVIKNNYMSYYLNGKLAVKKKIQAALSALNLTHLYWGINPDRSGYSYMMDASFDDIKMYKYAFSDSQVDQQFKGESITEPKTNEPITFCFDGNLNELNNMIEATGSNYSFVSDQDRKQVIKINQGGQINFNKQIFPSGSSTVSFLYKKEGLSKETDNGKYIYQSSNSNNSYAIRIHFKDDGKAYLAFENTINGTFKEVIGKYEIEAGKWYAINLYYLLTSSQPDRGIVRLYQNGDQTAAMASVQTYSVNLDKWSLGGTNAQLTAGGIYDELIIEDHALNSAEINSYYTSNLQSLQLSVDYSGLQQTIRNFGASDAWGTQQIGYRWPEEKKEKVAELLFSKEFDADGNPKGIGLSCWRFNIGAGSSEQGDASLIPTYETRTECFLNPDMTTYNWDKQIGQQWFVRKAVLDYGLEDLVGFINSPPVYYTKTGYAFNKGGGSDYILKDDRYDDFAKFTADVVEYFKKQGMPFKYISPINEPQYEWKENAEGLSGQEGSPATNSQIANVVKNMSTEFSNRGLNTQIFVAEAGSIDNAEKQVPLFWGNTDANLKIGGLPNVSNIVSSHSYWIDGSSTDIYNARLGLKNLLKQTSPALEYFQTEYCLLGEGFRWGHPGAVAGNYTEMESAISLARMLHADLAIANATGWNWWTTFGGSGSEIRYVLIEAFTKNDFSDGAFNTTKFLYTLGQYSRFIRPGMKRVDLTRSDNMGEKEALEGIMASAYIDEKDKKVVIVATNSTLAKAKIQLSVQNYPNLSNATFTPYITSEEYNMNVLPNVSAGEGFELPPLSVVTFVYDPTNTSSSVISEKADNINIYPNPTADRIIICANSEIKSVYVYNALGSLVKVKQVGGITQTEISMSNLSNGVYFVHINSSQNSITKKITKIGR